MHLGFLQSRSKTLFEFPLSNISIEIYLQSLISLDNVGVLLPKRLSCSSLDRFFAEFDEALFRGGFIARMGGIDSRNRTSNVLK